MTYSKFNIGIDNEKHKLKELTGITSIDDCARECDTNERSCFSFSFCKSKSQCILSNFTDSTINNFIDKYTLMDSDCDLITRMFW